MSPNKRIVLNVAATYGRSLYQLLCGLVTARWVLNSLGQVDYGLYGVIGGLSAFIMFFSGLLGSSIGRFYAFAVGAARTGKSAEDGLEECRKWFNTALALHTVLPLILLLTGYPLGVWTIEKFLNIPEDRIVDCVIVFRYVCISSFVGMVSVPFSAMYMAKQCIAELTVYSFAQTTANVFFLYYMITHPGSWLVAYAGWTCVLGILPQFMICIRALKVFPECRINFSYCWNPVLLVELGKFAFWQFFGWIGGLVRGQGMSIVVNKFFGPVFNASHAVASGLAAKTDMMAAALHGAFAPAVTNLAGEGNIRKMLTMSYLSSKVGSVLFMIFAIPLVFDLKDILVVWLKNPPPLSEVACLFILAIQLLDQSSRGLNLVVNASGRVAMYCFCVGMIMTLSLPVELMVIYWFKADFVSVFVVLLVFKMLGIVVGSIVARRVVGYSLQYWFVKIFLPIVTSLLVIIVVVGFSRQFMLALSPLVKWVITALLSEVLLLFCSWNVIFVEDERRFVLNRISARISKLRDHI